jgi:hypothetical protein
MTCRAGRRTLLEHYCICDAQRIGALGQPALGLRLPSKVDRMDALPFLMVVLLLMLIVVGRMDR